MLRRRITGLAAALSVLPAVACGSGDTVAGKATTAAGGAPMTTSAAPTPTALPPSEAGTVLLKRTELGEIVGDTEMKEVERFQRTSFDDGGVDPFDCRSRMMLATMNVVLNDPKAPGAVDGDANVGVGGRFAGQVVTVYPDSQTMVGAFFAGYNAWTLESACPDGTAITLSDGDKTQQWAAGPVDPVRSTWTKPADITRMSTVTRRQDPTPRTCAHVFSAQGTVVVEGMACGPDDAAIGQAAAIVDRIQAKLPK